jgi:DNA processing protein
MTYSENAINILTAKTYKGIGSAWIVKNLRGNENIEIIVSLINRNSKQSELITIDDFESRKHEIKEKLCNFEDSCDGLIAIGDKKFPQYRGNVKESEQPIFLFYKGDIDLLDIDNCNISVIGLLNPDETIETRERAIVKEIVKREITIVSGLAFGCDSIAHQQAMIGGKTIAILPSPLNDILPAKNRDLAFKIVEEGGLLITEYYEKFKSKMELSSRYKERDRLQALFCDTIILAASYAQDSAKRWNINDQKLDSGARLAMEYANNYKIPRAVMYNENTDINNPMFDLNRQLIDEQKDVTILTPRNLGEIINAIKNKERITNRMREKNYNTGSFNF